MAIKLKFPKKPLTVTIREIETKTPCSGEYVPFLQHIKSRPLNEDYLQYAESWPKKSKYGPDDPIEVSEIRAAGNCTWDDWILNIYSWPQPIRQLLDSVDRYVDDEVDMYRDKFAADTYAKIFGKPKPKRKK